MTADRWEQLSRLLDDASAFSEPDRAAFLDRACPPDLRAEVERLLVADAEAGDFFDTLGGALAPSARPDQRLGPWRIRGELGRGGMGTVYRAARADGAYDQEAALKVLDSVRPDVVARFHRERQILARLDHPGIARLLDGGTTPEGRPYLVMELVRGEPITAYAARRALGVDDRIDLFARVCEVVQAAHRQLVVHRDLKPSNVFVVETNDGPRVKLLDFGIARILEDDADGLLTLTEHRALTPEYAAPEQVRGERPTTATDVYALGVLLYELLAGVRPFDVPRRLAHEAARVVLEEEPERPSTAVTRAGADALAAPRDEVRQRLVGDLDAVCLKALRKEPERRYATAEAFARDLDRHLRGLTVEARPDTFRYRASRFARRNRGALLAAVVAVAGLVAGLGAALWQRAEAVEEATRATAAAEQAARTTAFLEEVFAAGDPFQGSATLTVRDLLGRSLDRIDEDLAGDPATQADLLTTLGRSATQAGLLDTAAVALDRALALRRELHPDPHVDVAETTEALAFLHVARSENAAADSLYRLAVETREAAGDDGPGLVRLLMAYAGFETRMERHASADALARRAAAAAGALGDPLLHADALFRLAETIRTRFRDEPPTSRAAFGELVQTFEGVRDLRRDVLGAAHPQTAAAEGGLGRAYRSWATWERDEGDPAREAGLRRRAYEGAVRAERGLEAALGPDHARAFNAYWIRASMAKDVVPTDTAIRLHRDVFERTATVYGPDHTMRAMAAHNLHLVYSEAGDHRRALGAAETALGIYERTGQTRGTPYSARLYYVAAQQDLLGQRAEACAGYRRALASELALPLDEQWGSILYRSRGAVALCDLEAGRADGLPAIRATLDSLRAEGGRREDRGRLIARYERALTSATGRR